jgi:hypothetical protein
VVQVVVQLIQQQQLEHQEQHVKEIQAELLVQLPQDLQEEEVVFLVQEQLDLLILVLVVE